MEAATVRQELQNLYPDKNLTILTIDDREEVVQLFSRMLTVYGQTAITALSGEEGLKIFEGNAVDAILCDLEMPGINGLQVGMAIRDICRVKRIPKPPFVLVTGSGYPSDVTEMLDAYGVDAVVAKPVDVLYLLEVIGQILADGSRMSE